jgi:hypothetical protein
MGRKYATLTVDLERRLSFFSPSIEALIAHAEDAHYD